MAELTNALEISPTNKLTFTGPFTRRVSSTLTLRNVSTKSIYFKMKCSQFAGNSVIPSKGIIMPSESTDVKIFIEPFKEDPGSKYFKFLVQYLHSKDDKIIDSVDNVFKSYEQKIPHFLLECDFLFNPFDDDISEENLSQNEDLCREVLELRKENVSLKEEIESLNLALNLTSNGRFSKSRAKTENEGFLAIRKSIESTEELKNEIISAFDKLVEKLKLRKESILKQLIEAQDKFTSETEIREKKLFHYKERLVRDKRAHTDVTDNLELDVQQAVNEFVLSKVGELSKPFTIDTMVYFEMDLGYFESFLESYIVFMIENGLS